MDKSQVIKAVSHYFKHIQQTNKLLLCSPTGWASSIIRGQIAHKSLN
jgi:hypothetical protein